MGYVLATKATAQPKNARQSAAFHETAKRRRRIPARRRARCSPSTSMRAPDTPPSSAIDACRSSSSGERRVLPPGDVLVLWSESVVVRVMMQRARQRPCLLGCASHAQRAMLPGNEDARRLPASRPHAICPRWLPREETRRGRRQHGDQARVHAVRGTGRQACRANWRRLVTSVSGLCVVRCIRGRSGVDRGHGNVG